MVYKFFFFFTAKNLHLAIAFLCCNLHELINLDDRDAIDLRFILIYHLIYYINLSVITCMLGGCREGMETNGYQGYVCWRRLHKKAAKV